MKDCSLSTVASASKDSATRLDQFYSVFINEVNTALKAQVKALGGNALLSYSQDSANCDGKMVKNQSYHIMGVKGDAVILESIEEIDLT